MKFFLTLIFSCSLLSLFAQVPNAVEDDLTKANKLLSLAIAAEDSDSLKESRIIEAINLYEKHSAVEQLITAKAELAYCHLYVDDEQVRQLLSEIEEIAKANKIADSNPSMFTYFKVQQGLTTTFNIEKSMEYGEKALILADKSSPDYFLCTYLLATSYLNNHQMERGYDLLNELERELYSTKNPDLKRFIVPIYNGKMEYNLQQSNFEAALIYGKKALEENKKYQEYTRREEGGIFITIGRCYLLMEQYEKSIDAVFTAIERYNYKDENIYLIGAYSTLAQGYELSGNYEDGIKYYKKAISLLPKTKDYASPLETLNANLAQAYLKNQELALAEKYILESMSIMETSLNLCKYAAILLAQEKYEDALVQCQKSLRLVCNTFQPNALTDNPSKFANYSNNLTVGSTLSKKSLILLEYGKKENSVEYLQAAITTAELAVDVYKRQVQKFKGYETSRLVYSKYLAYPQNRSAEAYFELFLMTKEDNNVNDFMGISESKKSLAMLESLTDISLPEEMIIEENGLVSAIADLEQKIATNYRDSVNFYENKLFEVNQKMEEYIEKLKIQNPKFANDFYNIEYATVQQIQSALNEETVFVEYLLTEDKAFILVIDKNRKDIVRVEIDKAFDTDVKSIRNILQNPLIVQKSKQKDFIEISNRLHQKLIGPIAEFIKGKKRLMIVPENELFYVPFETLLATNEQKAFNKLDFLIKEFEVNYHYSGTSFLQSKAKEPINDASMLAFAPVFENNIILSETTRSLDFLVDSLFSGIKDNYFTSLPSTKEEVGDILKILDNGDDAVVLLEKEAIKSNLDKHISNKPYQFIHIATHGLVNYKNHKLSGLACYHTENQELKGDLYFSGEIQREDIQADLVVLSSCESGIGKLIRGEGLISLNRSFIYAGAKNVLFSLWKVNDSYTKDLMVDFYRNAITKKTSYTTALRNAKLKMLANPQTASPRYWAPFVLMGE